MLDLNPANRDTQPLKPWCPLNHLNKSMGRNLLSQQLVTGKGRQMTTSNQRLLCVTFGARSSKQWTALGSRYQVQCTFCFRGCPQTLMSLVAETLQLSSRLLQYHPRILQTRDDERGSECFASKGSTTATLAQDPEWLFQHAYYLTTPEFLHAACNRRALECVRLCFFPNGISSRQDHATHAVFLALFCTLGWRCLQN